MKEEDIWDQIRDDLEDQEFAWMVTLVFGWARNKGLPLDKLADELVRQRGGR